MMGVGAALAVPSPTPFVQLPVRARAYGKSVVTSVSCLFYDIKYSGVPLPALHSNND